MQKLNSLRKVLEELLDLLVSEFMMMVKKLFQTTIWEIFHDHIRCAGHLIDKEFISTGNILVA
jgi:hypothetical protein